jgi:peptide/nickel transport system substrate-binding protein
MKKTLLVLMAIVMVLSVFAGCTQTEPAAPAEESGTTEAAATEEAAETAEDTMVYADPNGNVGGTLVTRVSGDPMSFCPSLAADDYAYPMVQNMFNRLTKLDNSKSPIPDAAESWDVSDDALTITFHLKDNMKWWDGEALDAEDVKYTFDYIKANETCYFSSSMGIVDSIEVVDPLTVVFHMNTADMSFVARLGWYGTFIVPEHIYNNGQPWEDNPAATTPVGSGPFMFDSYVQGESVTVVRNPDYHDGAPLLDKVVFSIIPDDATAMQALINGEIDTIDVVTDAYLDQLLADPAFRMDRNEYPSPWRFIFNLTSDSAVSDPAVRLAIAMCVDRNDISEKVTGGVMPPEWCAYPAIVAWAANTEDTFPDVDIEGARKVLEDAGYTADADGFYIRGLTLDAFEGQLVDMSRLVIANCAQAGIEVELVVSEYNAWAEKIGPGTDWMIEAQGGFMGPDPAALASRYGTGSSGNYASYANPEFDELCVQAAAEGDQDARAELYRQAQSLLIRDLPAINVLAWAGYEASRSDLANLPIDGTGMWGWQEYTYTYFTD